MKKYEGNEKREGVGDNNKLINLHLLYHYFPLFLVF
jgi:hypothetical protein